MSIVKIRAALEARLETVAPIIPAVAIASATTGANPVFTTVLPHGLITGLPVRFVGRTGGNPTLNLVYLALVLSPTTFSLQNTATKANIPVIIAGNGGSVLASLTAYANVIYNPVVGVPYQMLHMVPFKPMEPTQGGGYYKEHGLFQVTLVYPVGVGSTAILARAELIRTAFKKGSTVVNGGLTTTIVDTPEFGYLDGTSDSNQFTLPVKIGYSADIYC